MRSARVVRLLILPVNSRGKWVSTVMATAMTMMAENMEPITLCLVRIQEFLRTGRVSDDQFLFKRSSAANAPRMKCLG